MKLKHNGKKKRKKKDKKEKREKTGKREKKIFGYDVSNPMSGMEIYEELLSD